MSVATIGSALADKRRELGLEKGQAADKIGMSRTTYSSYEQDAQRPSVEVFPALAEFLSVSMEDLLALYGATCVAAIRPSLERLLSDRVSSSEDALDIDDATSRAEDAEPQATRAWMTPTTPSAVENAPVDEGEPVEITTASVTPEDDSQVLAPDPDVSNSALEPLVVLVQPDVDAQHSSPPPESGGWAEPVESFREFDRPVEPPAWLDPLPQSEESLEIGSVVFEPSPYFIRTSISDGVERSADSKKKKKKKKKNKSK